MCFFFFFWLFKGPLKKEKQAGSNILLLPAGGARAAPPLFPAAGGDNQGHALWANSNLRATVGATSIGRPAPTSQSTPGRVVLPERESAVEEIGSGRGSGLRLPRGAARAGTGEGEKREKAARGGGGAALACRSRAVYCGRRQPGAALERRAAARLGNQSLKLSPPSPPHSAF